MNKIVLVNDVDGLISTAHKAGNDFSFAFHQAAFNCLAVIDNSGDIRPLNKLYSGLSPAACNALKVWAVHFGKVKFDPENKGFKFHAAFVSTPEVIAERTTIGPMEYIKASKPKTEKTFDLVTELRKLRDKAEKHACQGPAMVFLAQAINA